MKKLLISVAVVLVVAILLPLGMGKVTKNILVSHIQELNDNINTPVHMALSEYHQGWFSSKAKIKVTIDSAALRKIPNFPQFGTIDLNITHGPLILGQGLKFGYAGASYQLDAQWPKALKQIVGDQKLFTGRLLYTFSGSTIAQISSWKLHVKMPNKDNLVADWDGVRMDIVRGKNSLEQKAKAFIAPLSITDNSAVFSSSSANMSSELQPAKYGLQEGDFQATMAHCAFMSKTQHGFKMDGFVLNAAQQMAGEKMNVSYGLDINDLDITNVGRGSLSAKIGLESLDAKALAEVLSLARKINAQNQMSQDQQIALGLKAIPIATKLIDNAKLNADVYLKSTDGVLDAKLRIQTPENPTLLMGPIQLAMGTSGTLDVTASRALVLKAAVALEQANAPKDKEGKLLTESAISQQIEKNYQAMIEKGWVSLNGDQYITRISVRNAKLYMNDHLVVDWMAQS